MGRFLTLAEFLARKGEERVARLSDSQEEQEAAIARAEEEAASYLATRYPTQLPTAPAATPETLKASVADAAFYYLATDNKDQISEKDADGYKRSVAYWKDVARGAAILNLPSRPAVDVSAPEVHATRGVRDLVFGHGGLDEW